MRHLGHPGPGQEKGEISRRGPNYPSWKEVGGGRPESAADLGQSPPCSGLSFPTRRLRLTVSIAALAPCGWSFPELGRTPSSARLPLLGPWPARSQKPITAAGATGAPGWPEGWNVRWLLARAGGHLAIHPKAVRPRQAVQERNGGGVGGCLTWICTRPARAFLSALRCSPNGRRVGRRPCRDTHSSLRRRPPRPRRGRPSGVPAVLPQETAGATGWATAKLAYPECTAGDAGPP